MTSDSFDGLCANEILLKLVTAPMEPNNADDLKRARA